MDRGEISISPAVEQRKRLSYLAVNLGLVANIFLAVVKTTIGILGHSPALLADGINSTSDVAYYLVVAIFMRLAGKPPDETHPYGHNQLESIASLVVGAFVVTTAVAIFWDAINNVFELFVGTTTSQGAELIALWIALFTVVLKIFLTVYTSRIATTTKNPAVLALAYDHRNDIFSAAGAAIGIYLGRAGYPWVDPAVGAVVALLVLRTGIEIIRQSSSDLMDAVPSRSLAWQIDSLLKDIPDVGRLEEVHAHR
ncbi:MAG: cation transporter, partial [Chloroflexi bacterium RBG_16_54_18]